MQLEMMKTGEIMYLWRAEQHRCSAWLEEMKSETRTNWTPGSERRAFEKKRTKRTLIQRKLTVRSLSLSSLSFTNTRIQREIGSARTWRSTREASARHFRLAQFRILRFRMVAEVLVFFIAVSFAGTDEADGSTSRKRWRAPGHDLDKVRRIDP